MLLGKHDTLYCFLVHLSEGIIPESLIPDFGSSRFPAIECDIMPARLQCVGYGDIGMQVP